MAPAYIVINMLAPLSSSQRVKFAMTVTQCWVSTIASFFDPQVTQQGWSMFFFSELLRASPCSRPCNCHALTVKI